MNTRRLWEIVKVLLQMLLPWNCVAGAFCFMLYSESLWERMLHIEYGNTFALGLVFSMHCVRRLAIGIQSRRQMQSRHALACFLLASAYACFAFFFIGPDVTRFSPDSSSIGGPRLLTVCC